MIEPDRPQMTVRRKRIACWIAMARDTLLEQVIITYCYSTAKMVTQMRRNVSLYVRDISWFFFVLLTENVFFGLLHRFLLVFLN